MLAFPSLFSVLRDKENTSFYTVSCSALPGVPITVLGCAVNWISMFMAFILPAIASNTLFNFALFHHDNVDLIVNTYIL